MNHKTHTTTGDFGDIIAAAPLIRHFGGGHVVIRQHTGLGAPREQMTEARANFLLPLIQAQPYVASAIFGNEVDQSAYVFDHFRAANRYKHGELLTHWMARAFKVEPRDIDMSPWLTVKPSPETQGKVVFARSPRYHNRHFPWQHYVAEYGVRAIFVGLPAEHVAFTDAFGFIPYREVKDALEMAELIAGSDLFIGNQSFPCWLAMGLGHPLIQETCHQCPNSRVVRHNAVFIADGRTATPLTASTSYVDAYTHLAAIRAEPWELTLNLDQRDEDWALNALFNVKNNGVIKWAAIHAGPSWEGFIWPMERWNAIAEYLQSKGYGVLLVGHGNDASIGNLDARERTTLGQLAALLDLCSLFVGIDSLPLRVAAAQGVQCIGLFNQMPKQTAGEVRAIVPRRRAHGRNKVIDVATAVVETEIGKI